MLGYLLCIAVGIIIGLLVEDALTTETKIENDVKIKQRGRENKLDVKRSIESHINRKEKKSNRKRLFKRKRKKK